MGTKGSHWSTHKYSFWQLRQTDYQEYLRLAWQQRCKDRHAYWAQRYEREHNSTNPGRQVYRARQHRGKQCEICGSTEKLCAHHRNQELADNRATNIMTVCISCHNRIHHRRENSEQQTEPHLQI